MKEIDWSFSGVEDKWGSWANLLNTINAFYLGGVKRAIQSVQNKTYSLKDLNTKYVLHLHSIITNIWWTL